MNDCLSRPDTDMDMRRQLLYAVAQNPDGGVELTVYEAGAQCCIELSAPMAKQLADWLTGQ